jgi:hypothetical protein
MTATPFEAICDSGSLETSTPRRESSSNESISSGMPGPIKLGKLTEQRLEEALSRSHRSVESSLSVGEVTPIGGHDRSVQTIVIGCKL